MCLLYRAKRIRAKRSSGGTGLRVECYSKRLAGQPYENDFGNGKTVFCINSYRTQRTGRAPLESTEQERNLCSMVLLRPVGKDSPVPKDRFFGRNNLFKEL